MSRTKACEDTAVIAQRLRELDAERVAARNAECEHEWNDWSSFCGKCGLSRAADIAEREGLVVGAAEGG